MRWKGDKDLIMLTSSISNEAKHHQGSSEKPERWGENCWTIYSIRCWSWTNPNTGLMTKWSQIPEKKRRVSSVWPAYGFVLAGVHGQLPLTSTGISKSLVFSLDFTRTTRISCICMHTLAWLLVVWRKEWFVYLCACFATLWVQTVNLRAPSINRQFYIWSYRSQLVLSVLQTVMLTLWRCLTS